MVYRQFFCISLCLTSNLTIAGTMGPEILPQTHWDGGVNIQVIQPFFQNNPAFYFLNARRDSVTEAFFQVSDIQNQRDVYHHMDLAPEFF